MGLSIGYGVVMGWILAGLVAIAVAMSWILGHDGVVGNKGTDDSAMPIDNTIQNQNKEGMCLCYLHSIL